MIIPTMYFGIGIRTYCSVSSWIRLQATISAWIVVVCGLRFGTNNDRMRGKSIDLSNSSAAGRLERTRIVNGTDVLPGAYPYVGELFFGPEPGCPATLIDPSVGITACHCLVQPTADFNSEPFHYPHKLRKPETVQLLIGALDLNHARGILRTAKKLIVHRDCAHLHHVGGKAHEMVYDYALIIFAEPFTDIFGYADVIPLPNFQGTSLIDKMIRDEEPCVQMGWGLESTDAEGPSSTLKELSSKLRHQDWCARANLELGDTEFHDYHNTTICTTAMGMNQTACGGDSGGPLLCGKEQKHLIGVASYIPGSLCGINKLPTMYARVDLVADWINTKLKELQPFSSAEFLLPDLHVTTVLLAVSLLKYMS